MATPRSNQDLEARLAAVENALGGGVQPLAKPAPTPADPRRVRDLVLRAASDPDFATELIANPGQVGAENGLSPDQVERVRLLSGQGLLTSVLESRGVIPARMASEGGGGGYY